MTKLSPLFLVTLAGVAHAETDKLSPMATTERWGGGVRLTGLSGIGALPGVNFGVEAAVTVRRDELFAELALGRWTPEHDYNVADDGARTPLFLRTWTARAGWSSMQMPLRAWVLAEVGELAGSGGVSGMSGVVSRMVSGETPSERSWKALGGGVGVAWPMSQQARLVGTLELAIPVQREEVMTNRGAYAPDPLAARYSIGLEVGWR